MKKDKEWLKQELMWLDFRISEIGKVRLREVFELVDQLDEPEKPVVPQFVADCIEHYKRAENSLGELLAHIEYENLLKPKLKMLSEVVEWVYPDDFSNSEDRIDLIAIAWLHGYELEKEKLYRIKFSDNQYASRFNNEKISSMLTGKELATQYTEEEIKAIDKRYWTFAEEVKE